MPLTGVKVSQDRACRGVHICTICAECGARWAIPALVHTIARIQRHHSGRWVDKKLAQFFSKNTIRMTTRPFRIPDYIQTAEWNGAPNVSRDMGSSEIWDNALNPFKLKTGSGDWVWCTDPGAHTKEISASDRIPLCHYRFMRDHTRITCQPAIRLCSPLLISDWVNVRRASRALAGYWRSPNHAELFRFHSVMYPGLKKCAAQPASSRWVRQLVKCLYINRSICTSGGPCTALCNAVLQHAIELSFQLLCATTTVVPFLILDYCSSMAKPTSC